MRSKVAERILSETPEDVRVFVRMYSDIVVRVNQLLKSRGYSQKDLAAKMDKTPSEISKWLNGDHNLTLRSLAKLTAVLGEPIIQVTLNDQTPNFTRVSKTSQKKRKDLSSQ